MSYLYSSMMLSVGSMSVLFVSVPVALPRVTTLHAAVSSNMRQLEQDLTKSFEPSFLNNM